jgi:hypothetical protein
VAFNGVAVYVGEGNGQFQNPLTLKLTLGTLAIVVGDFYNDRIQTRGTYAGVYRRLRSDSSVFRRAIAREQSASCLQVVFGLYEFLYGRR